MNDQPLGDIPQDNEGGTEDQSKARTNLLTKWMEWLAHLGLGETAVRLGTNVLTIVLVLAVAWLMQTLYRQANSGWTPNVKAAAEPTDAPGEVAAQLPV